MNKKKIVSVRFSDKRADRITCAEWETFRAIGGYFSLSDSELIEAALQYAGHPTGKRKQYVFNETEFLNMCRSFPALIELKVSLATGRLERRVVLEAVGMNTALAKGTLVRYYPPYVISVEPTVQMRINIDLSQPLTINADKDYVKIICAERNTNERMAGFMAHTDFFKSFFEEVERGTAAEIYEYMKANNAKFTCQSGDVGDEKKSVNRQIAFEVGKAYPSGIVSRQKNQNGIFEYFTINS